MHRVWTTLLVALLLFLAGRWYMCRTSCGKGCSSGSATSYAESQAQQAAVSIHRASVPMAAASTDMVRAASLATPAVVHVKSAYARKGPMLQNGQSPLEQLFKDFFGDSWEAHGRRPERRSEPKSQTVYAAGSGVIVSADGYIITNEHVVSKADTIEVTLEDNRKFTATLVGADPGTDLALLRIEAKDLPCLSFGSSDALRIAEPVLAVGNPFNLPYLTSTVTAGIVSAKTRNIGAASAGNALKISSFIQTDAAVNSGNSGGALVNLQGELVGIITAIATPTGAFAGYSFAIPSSIVQKVSEDLKRYGVVQRALLGVAIRNVDADLAKARKLSTYSGVYVEEVDKAGNAYNAGIKAGDVIVAIGKYPVKNASQLQERMVAYGPGAEVELEVQRAKTTKRFTVKLKSGVEHVVKVKRDANKIEVEGAELALAPAGLCRKLGIASGIQIAQLRDGKFKAAGMRIGFVITHIDKEPLRSLDHAVHVFNTHPAGGLLIGGVYPNGVQGYYGIGW